MATWFCYGITPIDMGWELLPDENDFAALLGTHDRLTFYARLGEVMAVAKKYLHWEGDFAVGPCVFTMPVELEIYYGFVWKQSNNGSCFVASPVELPHLDPITFELHDT